MTTSPTIHTTAKTGVDIERHRRSITKTLAKQSFCTLATTSPAGRPHVAGVVYEFVDGVLWMHSMRSSRKARSIAANGYAAVTVPFRKLPAGPPFTVHFQATADVVDMDAAEVQALIAKGALSSISGHGALDEPDGCFIKVVPRGTIHSYGPGARVRDIIRDPLHNGFMSFEVPEAGLVP